MQQTAFHANHIARELENMREEDGFFLCICLFRCQDISVSNRSSRFCFAFSLSKRRGTLRWGGNGQKS